MTGRPWYAFYPDAYERDAGHLSYVQDSAYRRMLDLYYKTGLPLPLDHSIIFRSCRAMERGERAAIEYCLTQFFERREDGYHNARADAEIAKAEGISEKRAAAASKRHNKTDANDHANADAIAEQLDTHLQLHSTATPSEAKASSGLPAVRRTPSKPSEVPGFAEFYAAFPLHKARPAAAKAYARALSRASAETILDGARRYAESRQGEDQNFTKHPSTWLNNDCWADEIVSRETTFGARNGRQRIPTANDKNLAGAALAIASFGEHDEQSREAAADRDAGGLVLPFLDAGLHARTSSG